MTGPEHYREAERLLTHTARGGIRDRFGQGDTTDGVECARQQLAEAQVHATLALAAATALGTKPSSNAQMREWAAAIGDPYER